MNLKVKALSPKIGKEIPAPFYASAGAAAMNLPACVDETAAKTWYIDSSNIMINSIINT